MIAWSIEIIARNVPLPDELPVGRLLGSSTLILLIGRPLELGL